MKKIIFLVALFITFKTSAQLPTVKVTFSTIQQMEQYTGSYTECYVDQPGREGYFFLKSSIGLTVDSGMIFNSAKLAQLWVRDLSQTRSIFLSWYGPKGDGITNDYYRLKAFCDYVTNDSTAKSIVNVYFEKNKTYYINYRQTNPSNNTALDLNFTNLKGVNIWGGNSTILINGNFTRSGANDRMVRMCFDNCKNISINDLTIDHQSQLTVKNGYNEAGAHAFMIKGGDGILINNCIASNAGCDGFNINETGTGNLRPESRNITLINCRSFFSARQGISIIQCVGFTAINCMFKYTGQNGGASYAPQSGCDIEPNRNTESTIHPYQNTGNIHFINCIFAGNNGSQFICGGSGYSYHDITIEGCTFNDIDSANGIVYKAVYGSYSMQLRGAGCRFINNSCKFSAGFLGLGYGDNDASVLASSSILVQGNTFTFADSALYWIRGNASFFKQIKFINNNFIGDSTNKPLSGSLAFISLNGSQNTWENNYVFVPKEKFNLGNITDNRRVADFPRMLVRNSVFETDLTPTYGGAATAHYVINFDSATVENVRFIGTNPGLQETIRPMEFGNDYNNQKWTSLIPVSRRKILVGDSIVFSTAINVIPNKMKYAQAIPTAGDYIIGDIIFNSAAAAGQPAGWICITASVNSNGGTWQAIGAGSGGGVSLTNPNTWTALQTFSAGVTITKRASVTTTLATLTPNISTGDIFIITAQASALTIAAPSGTPVTAQEIIIRIKDNGTLQTLSWNAIYRSSLDLPLPLSTTAGKEMYLKLIYNAEAIKWDLIGFINNY